MLGALATLAEAQPVAVFLEDLHWADQATRDLLGFLFTRIRRERLAIIASFRSDDLHRRHPLRPVLAEWGRLPAVARVQLDRLAAGDVRRLVHAIHPEPLAEADLASIVSRADGNAFFTEELVAATEQCHDAQHLPWQLADLLLVRLDRLSDDARTVVRIAAVGGRRVAHGMLADVAALPPERLDAALRDAIDAHVLELTSSGRGYVFRHALVAEAVYDDLLPGERVRLHAAYAAVLAEDPNRSRAELARHALASHDLDTAYLASVQAGDEAMAVAAPQDALAHYEMALDIAPRAAHRAGRPRRPRAGLRRRRRGRRALAARRRPGPRDAGRLPADTPDLSRAKLLYAMVRATLGGEVDEQALAATSTALRLVPEDPPTPLRARLLAQYARVASIMGLEVDSERSATRGRRARRPGRRPADRQRRAGHAGRRRAAPRRPRSAVRLLRRVIARADRVGDVATELRSRFSLASLHHEIGDLAGAQQDFDEIVRAGRTHRPAVGVLRPALAVDERAAALHPRRLGRRPPRPRHHRPAAARTSARALLGAMDMVDPRRARRSHRSCATRPSYAASGSARAGSG